MGLKTESRVGRIRKVAVIGFGIMGQGIAQAFAQSGYDVEVFDIRKDQMQAGFKAVKARLKVLVQLHVLAKDEAAKVISRIGATPDIEESVKNAEFVEEVVTEDLAEKRKIFRRLDEFSRREAILASCTSSLPISEITLDIKRRNRCIGTHWFNPAYLMPLVEVVKGPGTSNATVAITKSLLETLGKSCVVCKDSPGFVANRIQHAMNNEAMLVLQEGLASAKDIDTAVKMSFGLRLPITGPLETLDLSGLDTALRIRRYMQRSLRTARFKPPQVLREKVKAGHLGFKSGEGFYEYRGKNMERILRDRDEKLVKLVRLIWAKRVANISSAEQRLDHN